MRLMGGPKRSSYSLPVPRATRYAAVVCLWMILAHTVLAQTESEVAVHGVVIPTGFTAGKYSAMIQIAVAGSPLPDATWDLEAKLSSPNQPQTEVSASVVAGKPGTPVVLEAQVQFDPGSHTLSVAARETTAGQRGAVTVEGNWPDPVARTGTISPVVLLQPAEGTFQRGEASPRGQGALARVGDDPVRTQLPTAMVSVVCRGKSLPDLVTVERKLGNEAPVEFAPIHLLPGGDQCAQIRDMIQPGTLREGEYRYDVRLVTKNGEIAAGFREFATASGSSPGH